MDELKDKAISAAKTYFGTDNIDVYCIPEHDAFLDAYEIGYAADPSDDGWTYCDDRLPDEDGEYVVTTAYNDVTTVAADELFTYSNGVREWACYPNVIAWRQKLEPAKRRDV